MQRFLASHLSLASVCVAATLWGSLSPRAFGGEPSCAYDGSNRALTVTTEAHRRFRYEFNPGGAVSGIYDLDLATQTNLVGESYQGETTDRVIQWTYWNSRYLAQPHDSGDGDRRANVTMEGSFGGKHICEVLDTPSSGNARSLTFRSRITHWFYSELDRHGRPDFETTSRYEVLDDGSLKLERAVVRKPWSLHGVVVKTRVNEEWLETECEETDLAAEHDQPGSLGSYFEAWIPLRRTALPQQCHGKGKFDKDGYHFWKPRDLGGWAMAYSETLGVAVVFGDAEAGESPHQTSPVFNKQDLPGHRLNVLLPGVETNWPENATLTQTLIFVVGEPNDVRARATRLSPLVPRASVDTQ